MCTILIAKCPKRHVESACKMQCAVRQYQQFCGNVTRVDKLIPVEFCQTCRTLPFPKRWYRNLRRWFRRRKSKTGGEKRLRWLRVCGRLKKWDR